MDGGACRGEGSVAVPAGTPAVIPLVAGALYVAAVAFGGAAIVLQRNRAGGLRGQAVQFGQTCALGDAVSSFFIKLLCHGGRAAYGTQAQYLHSFGNVALAQRNRVTHAHFTRGLGGRTIDRYPVFADLFHGQAAGFVKAGSPEPFVQTEGGNFTHAGIVWHAAVRR